MKLPSPSRRAAVLAGVSALTSLVLSLPAAAADPLTVGILIPGSKSDKGWMESGYDGLVAAQKEYGPKIKVQMIENINYADMEQALTNLATKNALVIGVGGQTQAAVLKVAHGPLPPDEKMREMTRLQTEFQSRIRELYGG